jgi:hypothetical protein
VSNLLAGIERLNTAVDVGRQRRALTADEVSLMIESARSSGVCIQRYSGEQRARIHLLSYLTGLRKKELASLTPGSFDLTATPPTLTVEATVSKHRRKDVLPSCEKLGKMVVWQKKTIAANSIRPWRAACPGSRTIRSAKLRTPCHRQSQKDARKRKSRNIRLDCPTPAKSSALLSTRWP